MGYPITSDLGAETLPFSLSIPFMGYVDITPKEYIYQLSFQFPLWDTALQS